MKVLVLESVSGLHDRVDSKLFPEGFAILRTLTDEFSEAGFEVISTVNRDVREKYGEWLSSDELFDHDELDEAIKSGPDAALVVAPETNGELGTITEKLERDGIPVLGSDVNSIEVSGDKWSTYSSLKGVVSQPVTWSKSPDKKVPLVIKPRFGVGSEGVQLDNSVSLGDFEDRIFQEYIEGDHLSSCLLMSERGGAVLSINRQIMEVQRSGISYSGNVIPFEGSDSQKRECEKLALKAAESLGMRGYCGVDLVLSENPYFIEANPRVTTSFVGLARIVRENLGNLLIDVLLEGGSVERPELGGVSVIRTPKVKKETEIQVENMEELEDIPEVFAPPFPYNGCLDGGAELFVSVGHGSSKDEADKRLKKGAERAFRVLGVNENDVAWT